jgi:aminoglycoside 3-N-acetyltransferase
VGHLPPAAKRRIRQARRSARRFRYRLRQRVNPITVDLDMILEALHGAGLGTGDAVFFQSAMSSLGHVDGGAWTVIDALNRMLGDRGLIAMPAFPIVGTAIEYLRNRPVFDVRTTPSAMGAISECFRQREGTVRSIHPTHSVSVCGLGAADLIATHHQAATPFGDGTPFAGLIERDAYQVWFGCGVRAFTMYHAFECLRASFPLKLFLERPFETTCVDWQGHALNVSTLVHDPAILQYRIDSNPAVAEEWRQLLRDCGAMRVIPLGDGEVLVMRLARMMVELERLLADGMTIYKLPVATH